MTSAPRSARILRNTLSNSVGKAVSILTTFAMMPFILGELGESAFGIWALATAVISYGTLLDLGIGSAIVKYVAEYQARGDLEAGRALVGTATLMFSMLAVVGLALGVALSTQITRFVDVGRVPGADASAVLLLLSTSFALNLAATPTTATLRGLQRYDITNALSVASALVTAALTVVVLRTGGGLVEMVALTIPVSATTQLIGFVVVRRVEPELTLRWSPASREAARRLTGFGATLTVSQLAMLLQKRSSEVIVAAQLSAAAVAPLSLSRRLSDLPQIISDQFVKVLLPVASELHTARDPAALRRLYLAATRVTLGLMVPLALAVSWLAGDLLELWIGPSYRQHAELVALLVAASVALTSQWPAGAVFQGMGQFGAFAAASLVSGVVTVVLTLWWVQSSGLLGVVAAVLVTATAEVMLFRLPYSVVKLEVSLGDLARQVVLPVGVAAVPCAALLAVADHLTDRPTYLALALACGGATVVFGATYLAFPASRRERTVVLTAARRLVRRVRSRTA